MTIKFYHAQQSPDRTYNLDGNTISWDWEDDKGAIDYPIHLILQFFADGIWVMLPEEEIETIESNGVAATSETGGPIASDGGSSTYYDIELPKWLIARILERYEDGHPYIKTEELIEVAFKDDFDAGNAFKSLVRLFGAFNGAGKAGNSVSYERKKIEYSVNKLQQRFDRLGAAQ